MAAKLADMQEGVETAFSNVQLDEKTQHEECPDNVKDALLFKVKSGVSSVSSNANRVFRFVFCITIPIDIGMYFFQLGFCVQAGGGLRPV